jgi:methylmalonyl-CoA mutase C-terminal domain/subunit
VRSAIDEDAAFIGLSSLSGAHGHLFPKVCQLLRASDMTDVIVFGGGIIPDGDHVALYEAGVRAIFGPGTATKEIVAFIDQASERECGVGASDSWFWQGM